LLILPGKLTLFSYLSWTIDN